MTQARKSWQCAWKGAAAALLADGLGKTDCALSRREFVVQIVTVRGIGYRFSLGEALD
jgi:hypothetical protein